MTRLALLSVSDKTGIIDLAKELVEKFDFEIVSSGGTAKSLQAEGIPVTYVGSYTGAPEILGGRVKTLHPLIHGGILGRRDFPDDIKDMEENNIRPFDLVVVNLYPFEQTVANPEITLSQAIEQIDIGGPTMLRAAAKNFAYLTVLCEPIYYQEYLKQVSEGGPSLEFRQEMALATFQKTQTYDLAISSYFSKINNSKNPTQWSLSGNLKQVLRYGENPHQKAFWYSTGAKDSGWAAAKQLQGKELSYNNLVDLEAARRLIVEFSPSIPAAAILKHTNPCGVALGTTLVEAYTKAFNADSVSAFGGIVALNQSIDLDTAKILSKTFLECIVAPGASDEAREVLGTKSNLRVLLLEDLLSGKQEYNVEILSGGFLLQSIDTLPSVPEQWQVVTSKQPTADQIAELLFAWNVVKHVKSNAIVVTKGLTTLGIGAGQMNRVGSVGIALEQAKNHVQGSVLASDGFFPFDDSVKLAAQVGVSAIIQPGGSMRDSDSVKAADDLGIIMLLTGTRHFLH
jgi:phosphoribosylaminoimidazolecarboxamide formyltransferase/IMP cyclohydrolase